MLFNSGVGPPRNPKYQSKNSKFRRLESRREAESRGGTNPNHLNSKFQTNSNSEREQCIKGNRSLAIGEASSDFKNIPVGFIQSRFRTQEEMVLSPVFGG